MALQFRHGDSSDFDATKLLAGEPAYCTNTKKAFLGDGAGGAMAIGNMFTADFANGSGPANTNKVDHAGYADRSAGLVGEIKAFGGVTAPAGTLMCGQSVSRTTYSNLFNALTFMLNITSMTSGSPTVSISPYSSNLFVGEKIEGPGIPANATIISATSTSITMSANATATATSGTIRVFPWGNGDGSTTFSLPPNGVTYVGYEPSQSEFNALGLTGGSKTQTHPLSDSGQAAAAFTATGGIQVRRATVSPAFTANVWIDRNAAASSGTSSFGVGLAGNTDPASNLQPYAVVNYIIVY